MIRKNMFEKRVFAGFDGMKLPSCQPCHQNRVFMTLFSDFGGGYTARKSEAIWTF